MRKYITTNATPSCVRGDIHLCTESEGQCYTTQMRFSVFLAALGIVFFWTGAVRAQVPAGNVFTQNLVLGSSGAQVILLQKVLNSDPVTRIASTGPGSPGQETTHFGLLTKAAVIRFQEKFSSDILTPSGLTSGNGRVGGFTRAKLNTIAFVTASTTISSVVPQAAQTSTGYNVRDDEKIDIYAGDKMIVAVQQKMLAAINTAITAGNTASIVVPTANTTDVPSVILRSISPQSALPGASVSITANGALANSIVYFGSDHIVRAVQKDLAGNLLITVPPLSPGMYDIAVKSGSSISNTMPFVVVDSRNPPVHIESISPATTTYNGTITITGSGFAPQNNTVVTTFQKFTGVPSSDGNTMTITVAPETLREAAKIGNGKKSVPMFLTVENDYGFSDTKKVFTMTL